VGNKNTLPTIESITVYPKLEQHKTFDINDSEMIDEIMDIRLPIQKIFAK